MQIVLKGAGKDVNKYGDDDSGIKIEHIMASGSLPELYDFQEIKGRKFCDGGLRSNTPFKELLQAHQSYWKEVMEEEEGKEEEENENKIPELEVYIINVHPPKQDTVPSDYDGVKDRVNDIIYSDRTSHYDENMAHLVTDYTKFTLQMKKLAKDAISKVDNETDRADLQKKFEAILTTTSTSKDERDLHGKYKDLVKGQFELTKVMRIEHTDYTNSVFGKTADLTLETIEDLIK
jgi:NTE family protein